MPPSKGIQRTICCDAGCVTAMRSRACAACTVRNYCINDAQGHCWVEGDNPDTSTDSRSRYGAVWAPLLSIIFHCPVCCCRCHDLCYASLLLHVPTRTLITQAYRSLPRDDKRGCSASRGDEEEEIGWCHETGRCLAAGALGADRGACALHPVAALASGLAALPPAAGEAPGEE